MEKISLLGENYHGFFDLEGKNYSWIGGNSESGDRNEIEHWYEGVGQINNLKENHIRTFIIKSLKRRDENFGSLEEALGLIIDKKRIINFKGIYDILLEDIYNRTRENKEQEIIPIISCNSLSEKVLLDKGLISEPNPEYQTRLTLDYN
jgi:hypothetical protein